MESKQILDFLWNVVVVDGWAVAWRVGLLSVLFGFLSLPSLAACYRFFYRADKLKLSWKHERWYEYSVVGLWFVLIPSVSIALGSLIGAWWAGGFLIKTERLGERVGKKVFQAIAAGVVSSKLEETGYTQAELAQALMKGEQKVTITQLNTYTSHHAGELSATSIEALLPIESDGKVHHGTVWLVEKTLDAVVYCQLNGQGDAVYHLAQKVAEHDRVTDNDGLVTVQEISDVACRTLLDQSLSGLWTALMLQLLLPMFMLFWLIPIAPPLLAWVVRKTKIWWDRRQNENG